MFNYLAVSLQLKKQNRYIITIHFKVDVQALLHCFKTAWRTLSFLFKEILCKNIVAQVEIA